MGDYLLFNGSYHKDDVALIGANNRGLRYGDGLFETLRVLNGQIHFKDAHFERLFNGLQSLQFEIPVHLTPTRIAEQVVALCQKNRHSAARVRINIVRGNGGLYGPDNHFPNYMIQSWPLPQQAFQFNENGLVTGIYEQARKAADGFSAIKSNNCLPYSMAALYAQKNRWNDAFILNAAGNICDTTIANVFIIKNNIIYTCPLSEGPVAGILRGYLLRHLPVNGFTVVEQAFNPAGLYAADEIFLTNAIKGIRWVKQCGSNNYTNRLTAGIFDKLLTKLP